MGSATREGAGGALRYDAVRAQLRATPRRWLVTGVAGFIGSNLLETLLGLGQSVTGIDNFATGRRENLELVKRAVGDEAWGGFTFIEGDIRNRADCLRACAGADIVLHQAALGSVPRSIADPLASHDANCTGFVNMLHAARESGVGRFVYASSSSVYGDHPALPKVEHAIGEPLSPYAATKRTNEIYARTFARCYGIGTIGLRYFNIFGPRQDPNGAYAAVIPRWLGELIRGETVAINGDGTTSRDFCFVANAVQANILAGTVEEADALDRVYNIAVSDRTTLRELYELQRSLLAPRFPSVRTLEPLYLPFRAGDVLHSHADITLARTHLGYEPTHRIDEGLEETVEWYVRAMTDADSAPARSLPPTRPAAGAAAPPR